MVGRQGLAIVHEAEIPGMQAGEKGSMGRHGEGNGGESRGKKSERVCHSGQGGIRGAKIAIETQVIGPERIDGEEQDGRPG
jgi:hypothetical protein